MGSALLGMGLGWGIDVFSPAMGRGYSSAEGTHITSAPSADKHLKDSGNMLSCPIARPILPTGMSNVGNPRSPGVAHTLSRWFRWTFRYFPTTPFLPTSTAVL